MFFDRHFGKGLAWYESHFRHGRSDQPVGEIAPTYFHSAEAREHIARTIPHCKIVCTLRDPVSRLYSLYRFMRQYGFTRASFERALEDFPFMMGSSRYVHHVSEWQRLFPRTTVVLYEDLREDPQGYLGAVCRFLEIRPMPLPPELWLARGSDSRSLLPPCARGAEDRGLPAQRTALSAREHGEEDRPQAVRLRWRLAAPADGFRTRRRAAPAAVARSHAARGDHRPRPRRLEDVTRAARGCERALRAIERARWSAPERASPLRPRRGARPPTPPGCRTSRRLAERVARPRHASRLGSRSG